MNATEIIGKRALDRDANALGKVIDMEVDPSTWTVSQITVKMGLIKKATVTVDKIDKVGDEVFLKVGKDQL
jgi:sporulation protein YlmC with PRC-barrel domain